MSKYVSRKYALGGVVGVFAVSGLALGLGGVPGSVPANPLASGASLTVGTSTLVVEKNGENVLPPVSAPREISLLFGGDVMLSRGIGQIMARRNDFLYPFRLLATTTSSADLTVMNLEGPISTRGKIYGSIYSFRADPRTVEGLVYAGVDVVSMANNHTGDYGPDALTDTLATLEQRGIGVVGAGVTSTEATTPHVVEVQGLKIAFLGATPIAPRWLTRAGSAPAVASLDENALVQGIKEAHALGVDMVVVLLHWGNEYETKHTPAQGVLARKLIDAGATMVIGHHPHVVQEVERYHGGVIAYSLGNFVFDQNFSPDTGKGLLLKVVVRGSDVVRVEEIPIRFSKTYQPFGVDAP